MILAAANHVPLFFEPEGTGADEPRPQDIAQHIKKTFDDRKGPTWHCIVGRNFGSFVTHGTDPYTLRPQLSLCAAGLNDIEEALWMDHVY